MGACVHYLVDGHNLIPKLGLRLDSFDDEEDLITRLQEFCRLRRARAEVYFDGAPPGQAAVRRAGAVTAHFVRASSSADAAIEVRLAGLGRAARNWTVVSSDGRLVRAAGAVHAGILSAEEFVGEMSKAGTPAAPSEKAKATLSPKEVEEWLDLFNHKKG
jgi:predicted RNA-binding protein with PIN domain